LHWVASSDPPVEGPVAIEVDWRGDDRALVRSGHAELDLSLGEPRPSGEGLLRGSLVVPGLDALFRATALLILARRGVFLVHASAIAMGDRAILLLGDSGAGKTTTARRLGREGLERLSDDLVALDVSGPTPLLHPVPFERGGRPLAWWTRAPIPCVGALLVRKGADVSRIEGPSPNRPHHLSRALVTLPPSTSEVGSRLDAFARVCEAPLGELRAAPSGELRDAVEAWGRTLRNPRVDAGRPLDGPARWTPMGSSETSETTTFVRAKNVAWRVLDGSAVLVSPASSRVQTLNPVATRIWEACDGRPIEAIVTMLVNEFEVSDNQARSDVECFVADLESRGLLVRSQGA
jgi:hypothetical protein